MDEKKESLDKSIQLIKDTTTNSSLKKMIEEIDSSTTPEDSIISEQQLKRLSHYTYQSYVKKMEK